jgi:cob(I)alamin adenosyltransferase
MSIITRRGDDGLTDVMYGERVPKTSPEVVACGAVDELNSCLGMARVAGIPAEMIKQIDHVQGRLVALMGLLSVPAGKRAKYLEDGYPAVGQQDIDWLENVAGGIAVDMNGWARPGASGDAGSAWMDMARSICRRAELSAWALGDGVPLAACQYLNRLSDILWLWARQLEQST